MDFINLTNDKLSVEEIMQKVTSPSCGAISLFVGTTRDNFEDKKVLTLEYEAYQPMAQKAMTEICKEMRDKWKDLENIAIYHRLGSVPVTESSVIIAISSPHRADALQATQWCIDVLKKSVPIWKKEVYHESEPQWKENSECSWSKVKKEKNKINPYFKTRVECTKVPSYLIQLNCTNEELQRRIEKFMQRKREQANYANIRDFCGNPDPEDSCARVNSVLVRRKDSKSHLKTQRVYNAYGPYSGRKNDTYVSEAVQERVGSIENCLNIEKPVSPDIYARLKIIEDRILYLESISPEYAHFWNKEFMHFKNTSKKESIKEENVKKRKYELHEIDNLIYELQKEAELKKPVT